MEGVKTLESGLQYLVISNGNGKKPDINDTVEVHYQGSLISGEIFDSSLESAEPVSFAVNGVIKVDRSFADYVGWGQMEAVYSL